MALTYNLPGDMTNGDLANDHPHIHEDLFGICLQLMWTGCRKVSGQFLDRMNEALDSGHRATNHKTVDEERDYWTEVYSVLRGMSTNVSPKTDKEWKDTLANT